MELHFPSPSAQLAVQQHGGRSTPPRHSRRFRCLITTAPTRAWRSLDHYLCLVGRWFVFWAVGVRLSLAGLRQFLQPAFTARQIIFHTLGNAFSVVTRCHSRSAMAFHKLLCDANLPQLDLFIVREALYLRTPIQRKGGHASASNLSELCDSDGWWHHASK